MTYDLLQDMTTALLHAHRCMLKDVPVGTLLTNKAITKKLHHKLQVPQIANHKFLVNKSEIEMLLQVPVPLPANTIPDLIVPSHIIVQRCSGQLKIFFTYFLFCLIFFFFTLLLFCLLPVTSHIVRSLSHSF